MGKKVVAIRHPMPYGDLSKQVCQRFATLEDLQKHDCTIEELEEYEPHIQKGAVVYAGVDYAKILEEAEKEADIILWDGGNNDYSFYKPDMHVVLVDPHRAGHELAYYPGEANLRMADVLLINKVDTAKAEDISVVEENARKYNPNAIIIKCNSPISAENSEQIKGKRVLVIEDGPTLTHGEMPYGAGTLAAEKFAAGEIVDPRPWATGTIKDTFDKFSHIGKLVPAMGYHDDQLEHLQQTINQADCDLVIIGTPIDLRRVIKIDKPVVRIFYDLADASTPTLADLIEKKFG